MCIRDRACSLFGISNDIAMQVVGVGFIIGCAMMAYNTARFDDPFDFCAAYNLTGCDLTQRHVSLKARLYSVLLLFLTPIGRRR